MGLTPRLKLFVSNGLFVSSWRTFLSCGYIEGWEEYLGLDECRLKMMSGELEESLTTSKVVNKTRVLEGVAVLVSYGTFME